MGLKFNPFTGTFDFTGSSSGGSGDMTKAVYDASNIGEQLVGLTATQTLTNKTLTSPKINENVALTTTATKLNLLTNASGTTGTDTTNIVFSTSPSLTTPTLGVASATSINKVALTAPASGSTLTILDGKTLTVNKSITLEGTDSTTMTFPTTSATLARTDAANTFTGHQTIEGVTTTGATGTGKLVFDGTPTLVTPLLGTPTSGTLTNCTGLLEGGLTLADNTTNNSSTSKHGFLPKLDNNSAHFLDGTGAWSTPGGSTNSTILCSSGSGTSATRYFGVGQSGSENATESNVWTFTAPFAGTVQNLFAKLRTAPGAGTSWTITVRTDQSVTDTMADTSVTCSIADTATGNSDTTHTATVSQGKRITIAMTRVSTASSPGAVSFQFEFVKS